jgi:hypothetical protein
MKLKKYIASLASLLLLATGFTACQDDFDEPGIDTTVYHATATANTTILELKTMYWRDDTNFCDTITPYTEAQQQTLISAGITPTASRQIGDPIVVKGRVISSDYTGNLYKVLVIQDETAAIAISIDHSGLYAYYSRGQEVVLSLDGRFIGKYAELMMLGRPEYTTSYGWQTGRMNLNFFQEYAEKNGSAYTVDADGTAHCNLASSDTTVVANIGDLVNNFGTPAGKIKWQSRLVRINNVWFTEGGQATFAEKEVTTKRYVTDDNGNELMVYNSGYADFWSQTLPAGRLDIVGIISYYNSTPQLLLLDTAGCMNVGNPTQEGTQDSPYTVAQCISFAAANSGTNGWFGGYIVGTVAPEVTSVTSNSDITWSAPFVMDNTLVLADDATCRDYTKCMIIRLPEGSQLFEKGNLADNPANLGKFAAVKGTATQVLSCPGVTGFQGTADDSYIDGVEIGGGTVVGDGSEDSPYSVTQVLSLNNPGTTSWVTGYIVGWVEGQVYSSGCHFNASATSASNVLIAADASETDPTKCIPVQLSSQTTPRTALNLMDNPGNLGKQVQLYGSLEKYFGTIGIKSVTNYKLDGSSSDDNSSTVTPSTGSGSGSQTDPYNVAAVKGLGNPGTEAWVGGYIVGVINPDNNYAVETSAPFNYAANILIADSPTDATNYIAVQLPYGTVRTALNLQDNPGNLGKYVKVYGSLSSYLQTTGVKTVTQYELDGASSDDDNSSSSTTTVSQTGTQSDPYTIASVLALNNPGTTAWATGYIVGWVEGQVYSSGCHFDSSSTVATNFLLADSPLEVNPDNCVPVQLPSGTIRSALNLVDNPGNYGKKITVNATLSAYFSRVGLRSVTEYAF